MKKLITRFFKFGIVGTIGTAIDFAVTALLMVSFGLADYYSMSFEEIVAKGVDNVVYVVLFANTIGFVVAATSNYYMNRIWTWRSKNPNVGSEYTTFFVVSVIGLVINLGVIYWANRSLNWSFEIAGIYIASFWVSKTLATGVVMFWNFFANNFLTFRKFADTDNLDDFDDTDAEDED